MKPWVPAVLLCLLSCGQAVHGQSATVHADTDSANTKPSAPKHVAHISMRDVLFHVMDNVSLQIDCLEGELTPSGQGQTISLDDKNSFTLEMQNATTSISSADLTALVNGFILPRAKTPLKNLQLTFNPDQSISVKGDLRKLIDVPISARATVRVTADGNMRMHLSDMTVAGVIHQDALDLLGLKISTLAQPKRKASFQIVGNDIIFPIDQMFPPPRVSGHLQMVSISGDQMHLAFDPDPSQTAAEKSGTGNATNPPTPSRKYIYFRGGTMEFGLLTMSPVNMELVPLKTDTQKFFQFSVDQYFGQLVAGYSKSLPSKGLLVYMADERDLKQASPAKQK